MTVKKKALVKAKSANRKVISHSHSHPDHKKELIKLKRAHGQLNGVMGMIEEQRYCPEILIQIRAAKLALQSVEHSILKTHLEHCVHNAISLNSNKEINLKIHELVEMLGRHL